MMLGKDELILRTAKKNIM